MQQRNSNRGCLQIMRDQVWGFVFGFLGFIVALAGLIFAIPQAAPIRSGIAQTFSGTPAPTPTDAPTPTPPALASAETLSENIVLKCNDCSDPVLVTITSIKVEPQNNRTIWALNLFNNSNADQICQLEQFSLQNPLDDKSFDATISPSTCYFNGGETTQLTAIFSFIPYTEVEYTLNASFYDPNAQPIPFLPTQITF